MSDNPKANKQGTDSFDQQDGSDDLSSNPILKKIARLLTNSSAQDWKQGGFELGPEVTIPRPIQIHEYVFVRDLPNNSLVIKSSTPVGCVYTNGGYKLNPIASSNYSVELRDRVFDPDKLVDPKFSSNFKGKYLEVLASGDVARKLFEDVRNLVRGSTRNLQKEFDEKSREILDTLLERVENSEITNWEKVIAMLEGRDNATYKTTHDGIELSVLRSVQGWDAYYELKIKLGKFELVKSGALPKMVFAVLEKQEQSTQLESLEKKLRDLGLEDD